MQISPGPFLLSSLLFYPGLDMCERALALKEGAKRAAGTFVSDGWVRGFRSDVRARARTLERSAALCHLFFPQTKAKLCVVFLMPALSLPC